MNHGSDIPGVGSVPGTVALHSNVATNIAARTHIHIRNEAVKKPQGLALTAVSASHREMNGTVAQ